MQLGANYFVLTLELIYNLFQLFKVTPLLTLQSVQKRFAATVLENVTQYDEVQSMQSVTSSTFFFISSHLSFVMEITNVV